MSSQGLAPTAGTSAAAADVEVALESLGTWQLAWRRFKHHKLAMLGLGIFTFMVLMAIIGPFFIPYNVLYIPGVIDANGVAHIGGLAPSLQHPFGTDAQGRDVLAMVVNGARISLAIGSISMLIAGFTGVTIGSIAGYAGGLTDNILMRVVDVFFAIPFLFVILVAARFFGQGQLVPLILIFGFLSWPLMARLIRAQFLSLREADFVEAARAVGVGDLRIPFRHILPNAIGPLIVAMTLTMASNIVLEAFVSFLNFGLSEDQISWGLALSNAQNYLIQGNWWWAFFPGMAIALTVLAINFVGDGLNDALDPRSRQ
jgi:peptide/nickel transport system permease protein